MGIRDDVCYWHITLRITTDIYSGVGISLYNGGPAGGIWLLIVVCFGMFFVTLSLAEMVSM
jgi:amino acid permease